MVSVEAWNRLTFEKKVFTRDECTYDYRYSWFKNEYNDPHIVTYINIVLQKQPLFHLQYGNLQAELAGETEITLDKIREVVIRIRRAKLPEPAELGNAGSFFTNPTITEEHFTRLQARYPEIPSYPLPDGKRKVPAGWLIEQCGFKGKSHGAVGVYEKQALVLVNLGDANGNEIALVAESIRMAVQDRFSIELIPEVKYIV
ncbi:MAG: hypothetical protein LIP01_07735 [Tannerellaceae bacterium]|nr:hypothetical protein [Tannerellaceae bacterium]